MDIPLSESRLPCGYRPEELGQATFWPSDGQGAIKFALVSLIESPVPLGAHLDYVVFVLDGEPVDRFDWKLRSIFEVNEQLVTQDLQFESAGETLLHYCPDQLGRIEVEVTLLRGERPVVTLTLRQHVVRPHLRADTKAWMRRFNRRKAD